MSKPGTEFYDQPAIYETYLQHRRDPNNPNDTIEAPIFDELLGPVAGLAVLDIGCGNAAYGKQLLERGAKSYLGLDGSQNMITASRPILANTAGRTELANVEDWPYPAAQFDLVISRLALHYLADLATLFKKFFETLKPGGRLVFSAEHPVITSHNSLVPGQLRGNWTVDDYFVTGRRDVAWLGGEVVKYHRTVEDYFTLLQNAGFSVQSLRESRPDPANFATQAEYQRRARIPLFLFLAAARA